MKFTLALSALLLAGNFAFAQQNDLKNIATAVPQDAALAPLKYLASDELKGRNIERPEINIAAQYIADQFKAAGAKPLPGAAGYFQLFSLKFVVPARAGKITIGNTVFSTGTEVIQTEPQDVALNAPLTYAGKGTDVELAAINVKGRVVLIDMGKIDQSAFMPFYNNLNALKKSLAEKGAVALIETGDIDGSFWIEFKGYLAGTKPAEQVHAGGLPIFFINSGTGISAIAKGAGLNAAIAITGTKTLEIPLKNVIAYVPGTDPKLATQYIMLSAHYDHLGVAPKAEMEEGKLDSIYNGARDNASGTTAVLAAARYFAKFPPKRPVIFIAYTAEEEGLLGSAYYAEHPVVPLKQTVYNLNIDNASYNDTTLISLVGLGRTSADASITKACKAYGLQVVGDPTGGQLFSGSDNYPLAGKGIPAPTFSLGMKSFDGTITNRYHRLSDEADNMDLNYVMKFIGSYILAAKYIADEPAQPRWTPNDEYEKAWHTLFGM